MNVQKNINDSQEKEEATNQNDQENIEDIDDDIPF